MYMLTQSWENKRSYNTIVLIIDTYAHMQKVIFQEVNSNICLLHSDLRLLFISILGFALIYTLESHLPVEKILVCRTFSHLLIGFKLLPLESLWYLNAWLVGVPWQLEVIATIKVLKLQE